MTWLDNVRDLTVPPVAEALGLSVNRAGDISPCPACGAELRESKGKRFPVGTRRDHRGWHCHRCKATGDQIDLASLVLLHTKASELRGDRDRLDQLRAWYADRGWCTAPDAPTDAPQPDLPEPPPPRPELRVPADELLALRQSCQPIPLDEDNEVARWLRGRQYDPAALRAARCVAVLPDHHDWPDWWPAGNARWPLVAILYDGEGTPCGVHGRAVWNDAPRKTASPSGTDAGYGFGGLWMMNGPALAMVTGSSLIQAGQVLVVEGITDWLRCVEIVQAAGKALPVVGGLSGSFNRLDQLRAPDSARFYIATDADDAGDQYADQAAACVPGRALRYRPADGEDLDDGLRSWDDVQTLLDTARPMLDADDEVGGAVVKLRAWLHTLEQASEKKTKLHALAQLYGERDALATVYGADRGVIEQIALAASAVRGISASNANKISSIARDAYRATRRTTTAAGRAKQAWGEGGTVVDGDQAGPNQLDGLEHTHPFTDLGNAERFRDHHRGNVRHCDELGGWYVWDGVRWERDHRRRVIQLAKATVRAMRDEADEMDDEDIAEALVNHARRSEGKPRLDAMVSLARSEPPIPAVPSEFDTDPYLLGVTNGVVDLRTGELREPRREDMLTKRVNAPFDPEAECPNFSQFLYQVMCERDELYNFCWRIIGYSLIGANPEQVMFLLHGGGRNGKSTWLNVLRRIWGDYARHVPPEALMATKNQQTGPNPEIARLRGSRLATTVEVERGRRLAESLVKQLTGGDAIVASYKFRDSFEFVPIFKLWFSANHLPRISNQDLAIWRRILRIPFDYTVAKEDVDRDLEDKLVAEAPGILRYAVAMCMEWQANGLQPPAEVLDATKEYQEGQDVLAPFLEAKTIADKTAEVLFKDLWKSYTSWAEDEGEKPMSKKAFGDALTERGFTLRKGSKGARFREGLRLIGEATQSGMGFKDA